jgi:subtilisin-like proprotein convertase family protein
LFGSLARAFLSVSILAGTIGALPAATFINQTPITMPAGGTTPYPSIINVSQLSGEITSVSVSLVSITHPNPDDLDVLLVSPQGIAVLLMSDAGGGANVTNVSVTFSETSRFVIPDTGPMVSGTYLPSAYDASDNFPNAPAPPYTTKLGAFDRKSPNGQWKLFVVDDSPFLNFGAINGGWRLVINTTNRPPVITTPLVDQVVTVGGTATFHVGVDGTPPFGYQWTRNGVVLVPFGQGTDTLQLFNVQPNQAGTYAVVVTNGFPLPASVGSQAQLTVLSPLMLEPLPALVETQPGGVVTLTAKATGTPPIRYQWLCNGMVVTNQTNSNFRITEINSFDAGSYSVVVWNDYETVRGGPTLVRVLFETGPRPQDFFQERPHFVDATGVVQGDSSQARSERGEPVAPGGGKTMWLEIIPRDSGIMTVRTRGSAFDTLLSVFSGKDFSDMKLLTQDDDRGGCYTSELQFNAIRGEPYQIQVDGIGGAGTGKGGPFTLSWSLEVTAAKIPVIVSNAQPQAVVAGSDAVFRVLTESTDVAYQWYFAGPPYDKPRAISGATEPVLRIQKVDSRHVGFYFVAVRNQFDRLVIGPWVALQIGNLPIFLYDKFETMYFTSLGTGEFVPIGLGFFVGNQAPSLASSEETDPSPCGNPFFGTLWLGLTPTNSGTMRVETTGSDIPARLAIYRLTGGLGDFSAPALICDVTSASNGVPAVVQFNVDKGTNYTVVVEGFQASGTLVTTSRLGVASILTNQLLHYFVPEGGGLAISSPATNWVPNPACQWRLDGVPIPNATNATLTLSNFSELNVGTYSIYVSNFVSTATRDVADVQLAPPFVLVDSLITYNGSRAYKVVTSNAAPFVLESTTDLSAGWIPVITNPNPSLILYYTNFSPLTFPKQFYRAVPWAPGP